MIGAVLNLIVVGIVGVKVVLRTETGGSLAMILVVGELLVLGNVLLSTRWLDRIIPPRQRAFRSLILWTVPAWDLMIVTVTGGLAGSPFVPIYEGAVLKEQTLAHQAGLDGAGGSSYIDSVILRTTYVTAGETTAEDLRFYYNQNWRADVGVVLDDSGIQLERAVYSPYGQPYGLAAGDTDFDGDHDQTDVDAIAVWNGYDAFADVDLNGTVSNTDNNSADPDSLGWDVLSSDDVNSRYGNAGYTQDRDISQFYHGRNYVYSNLLGRMVQRAQTAFDSTGTGAGVGFFPCYSPCGCEVGKDISSGRCSGKGVGLEPDPDCHAKCEKDVNTCLASNPFVISVVAQIELECGIRDIPAWITCSDKGCEDKEGGRFQCLDSNLRGVIRMCETNICDKPTDRNCRSLAHELIHLLQTCRSKWQKCPDTLDCFERACNEIQAYSESGQCCEGSHYYEEKKARDPTMTPEKCVKEGAIWSVVTGGECDEPDDVVDAVWSRCFKGVICIAPD
ncbi:MAG: hypothetical protein ACF8NJ_06020 [Phycisphaerales bacterium JB038]